MTISWSRWLLVIILVLPPLGAILNSGIEWWEIVWAAVAIPLGLAIWAEADRRSTA